MSRKDHDRDPWDEQRRENFASRSASERKRRGAALIGRIVVPPSLPFVSPRFRDERARGRAWAPYVSPLRIDRRKHLAGATSGARDGLRKARVKRALLFQRVVPARAARASAQTLIAAALQKKKEKMESFVNYREEGYGNVLAFSSAETARETRKLVSVESGNTVIYFDVFANIVCRLLSTYRINIRQISVRH